MKIMKPRLLLDACCGPCSTESLNRLQEEYDVTLLVSNHNVHPYEEYIRRKQTQESVAKHFNVNIIFDDYLEQKWHDFIKGFEDEPEDGKRCLKCFEYRFIILEHYARKHKFETVSSTLTISPYKDKEKIFNIARIIFNNGIKFLEINFSENQGYRNSIKLSKELNLYRQKYCGCIYSYQNK